MIVTDILSVKEIQAAKVSLSSRAVQETRHVLLSREHRNHQETVPDSLGADDREKERRLD